MDVVNWAVSVAQMGEYSFHLKRKTAVHSSNPGDNVINKFYRSITML